MARLGVVGVIAVVGTLATGCGGGDDGGEAGDADPIAPGEAQALCADLDDHATSCGWASGAIGTQDWNCGEAALVWRAEVFRAVAECGVALACDGDGASCFARVGDAIPVAVHEAYATACAEAQGACELTGTSDTSTLLLQCDAARLAAYAAPVVDAISACFELACDQIVACLDDQL